MIFSTRISSQEIPKPELYTQLPRDQKEAIAVCFEENFSCHQALRDADRTMNENEWTIALAFVLGLATSIGLECMFSDAPPVCRLGHK